MDTKKGKTKTVKVAVKIKLSLSRLLVLLFFGVILIDHLTLLTSTATTVVPVLTLLYLVIEKSKNSKIVEEGSNLLTDCTTTVVKLYITFNLCHRLGKQSKWHVVIEGWKERVVSNTNSLILILVIGSKPLLSHLLFSDDL